MSSNPRPTIQRIRLSDGTVIYDNGTVGLDAASIEVATGNALVILGQSGSGKSTLLRALAGLQVLGRGSVQWLGPDDTCIEHPWPMVTVVFQKLFLWPHLRVADNLLLPLRARWGNAAAARMDSVILEDLEIQHLLARFAHQLSVGQQQRVAIARAALLEPQFLLVDEVSSSLDPERTHVVYDLLRRLNHSGVAIVAVTHLPGLATQYFERFAFLHQGRIVREDNVSALATCTEPRIERYLDIARAGSGDSG